MQRLSVREEMVPWYSKMISVTSFFQLLHPSDQSRSGCGSIARQVIIFIFFPIANDEYVLFARQSDIVTSNKNRYAEATDLNVK